MILIQRIGRAYSNRMVRKGFCEEAVFKKRLEGQEGYLLEAYSMGAWREKGARIPKDLRIFKVEKTAITVVYNKKEFCVLYTLN